MHGGAEAVGVALVVGVGHQGHAGGHQLGACRLDFDVVEAQAVVGAGLLLVLHFCLGHRRLVVDVPHGRGLRRVGLAPGQVVQEHALADPAGGVADGGVGAAPVDRQPDAAPQVLEGLLVLRGQLVAQGDEVGPAHADVLAPRLLGRAEVGVVGERGVARHAVVGLHPAFGRQPVVVPSHGVEELPTAHAAVAGDGVGLDVAEDRPHVERARHGGRGRVDGEDLVPGGRGVEAVGARLVPGGGPALLEPVEDRLVGHPGRTGRAGRGGGHDRVTVPGCCTCTTPRPEACGRLSCAPRGRRRCTSAAPPSTTCRTSGTAATTSSSTCSGAICSSSGSTSTTCRTSPTSTTTSSTGPPNRGGRSPRWPSSSRSGGGRPWTASASCDPTTRRTPRPTWRTWSPWWPSCSPREWPTKRATASTST